MKKKMIVKMVALVVGLFTLPPITYAETFSGSLAPILFDEEYSELKRYTLISGPMFYQEEPSEEYTEGFRADETETLDGLFARQVYDYDSDQSARSIFHRARESLLSEGFELSFECEGADCGPVSGWRLLLSKDIVGAEDAQFYLAGRLGTRQNIVAAKAVYVTEFDSQPRMIVDTVQHVKRSTTEIGELGSFDSLYKTWRNTDTLQSLGSVFFSSNSKELASVDKIRSLVDSISDAPDAKYLLIGFSDPRGGAVSNRALSLERAVSLKEKLVSQFSVNSERLVTYGAGELDDGNVSLAQSRKVSIYRIRE